MSAGRPFDFLENWFGESIDLDLVKRLDSFPFEQAGALAEAAADYYDTSHAVLPDIPNGALRPYITPRRLHAWYPASANWVGLQSLTLLYAPEAVSPDPFQMCIDGWQGAGRPIDELLVKRLASALHTLALLRPSVARGALYLTPPLAPSQQSELPERFAEDFIFPLSGVEGSVIYRLAKEQFRRGGSWGTGVVNAMRHLNEIDRDLRIVSENAATLQPFFLNGWDRELAALVLDFEAMPDDHRRIKLGTLAAFDVASCSHLSHSHVAKFRESDAYNKWRGDLADALSNVRAETWPSRRIQSTVHEELKPAAAAMRKEIAALSGPLGGANLKQTFSVGAAGWGAQAALERDDIVHGAVTAGVVAMVTAYWGIRQAREKKDGLSLALPFFTSFEPPDTLSDYELRPLSLF